MSRLGPFLFSLHVLPDCAWVLYRYSGFLQLSKNMFDRFDDDCKLTVGVSVRACMSLCGPVMDS